MVSQLVASREAGARGVKVWKDLGLSVRDSSGARVKPEDPRVVTVLQAAGELGLSVLIHTADPVAFFDPLTPENERWDELQVHPEWWFGAAGPRTSRESAGCSPTTRTGTSTLPVGPAEIGRRPRDFVTLVDRFPDRVLFGTDCFPPTVADYARHRRFLETTDLSFAYSGDPTPPQGNWAIDGAGVDPRHLPGIYGGNARRILRLTD